MLLPRKNDPAHRLVLSVQLFYLIAVCLISIFGDVQPTPELLFAVIVMGFVWQAGTRGFVRDFFPFVMIFLAWQAMRGWADNLSPNDILISQLISTDRAMFGGIVPAVWLRENVYGTAISPYVNGLSHLFYLSHFVTPVVLAVLLWQNCRPLYWRFMIGLMALSYAGFATFVLFPAAPPWLASEWGYLPSKTPVLLHSTFPTVLYMASPNHVAAMPSLHAAYPTYIAVFCVWVWGKRVSAIFLLPLLVSFSAVWLGHHFVIDLIAGCVYGSLTAMGVIFWTKWRPTEAPVPIKGSAAQPAELEPAAIRI